MTIDPQELLAPRHAPGEDARPLVASLVGGVVGVVVMLFIDRIVPSPAPNQMLWPALLGSTLPLASTAGAVSVMAAAGALAALVFTYGQFRRFVPGEPWHVGLAWGSVCLAIVGPMLLPRSAPWLQASAGGDANAAVVAAALIVLEATAGLLAYGVCVGVANPRRQ